MKFLWLMVGLIFTAPAFADPTFVTSTFTTGNDGWQPNNWVTSTANPLSTGNPYLEIAADGIGPLGKMITFNSDSEWTGNYFGAGVTGVELDIINTSGSDVVFLRVAVGNRANPQQSGGTWWISKTAIQIPVLSDWTHVSLSLEENDLQKVGDIMGQTGNATYAETFGSIGTIRILSSSFPVGAVGDEFFGDVGIDNVALVPEPTTLPLLGTGGLIVWFVRRKRTGSGKQIKDITQTRHAENDFVADNRFI